MPPTPEAIEAVITHLRSGGVIGMPTETVYGLAGDTFNLAALESILSLKGRPRDNPMIAHISSLEGVDTLTPVWPATAGLLADLFWPGPLTIIVDCDKGVPPEATGGRGTIAIRWPDHPVAQAILDAFGGPLSAPSANISGRTSTTRPEDVAGDFANRQGGSSLIIVDGGACEVGVESTVIDLSSSLETPAILRPGVITTSQIREVIGDVTDQRQERQGDAPGTARRHYAPTIPLQVVTDPASCSLLPPRSVIIAPEGVQVEGDHIRRLPATAAGFGRGLYAALHDAQQGEFDQIVIVTPDLHLPSWAAISDRLYRASSV